MTSKGYRDMSVKYMASRETGFVSDLFLSSFRGLPHRGGFRPKYSFARRSYWAGDLYLKTTPRGEEISNETYAVCCCDCPTPAGWCHSDRARRRMRGRRR